MGRSIARQTRWVHRRPSILQMCLRRYFDVQFDITDTIPPSSFNNFNRRTHHSIVHVTSGNSGTFVRQSKLIHSVQPRVTLLQAVQQRYQGSAADSTKEGMTLGGSSVRQQVLVALVGEEEVLERQGQLDHLVKAALIDGGVCNAVCCHHHCHCYSYSITTSLQVYAINCYKSKAILILSKSKFSSCTQASDCRYSHFSIRMCLKYHLLGYKHVLKHLPDDCAGSSR